MDITNLNNEQLNELLLDLSNKNDEESYLLKAQIYYKLGNIDNAFINIIDCLNVSSKLYYPAILLKIDCLIKKNQFIEALKCVEEELSMPYIPSDYIDKFKEKNKEILNHFKENNGTDKFSIMDDNELGELLNSTNDYGIIMSIINQIYHRNIRNLLGYIKDYLSNKNTDNFIKSYLLIALNNQKIDDEILLVKDDLNMNLIPSNLTPFNQTGYQEKILKEIDKFNSYHNVTIEEISNTLLQSYLLYNYPLDIETDEYCYIGLSIYYLTSKSLCMNIDLDKIIKENDMSQKTLTCYLDLIEKVCNLC